MDTEEETLEENVQAGAEEEVQDLDELSTISASIEEWNSADEDNDTDVETLSDEPVCITEAERVYPQTANEPGSPRRASRKPKPRKMDDFITYQLIKEPSEDPTTRETALRSADKNHWQKAMEDEYNSLMENKTWRLVDLPSGRKAATLLKIGFKRSKADEAVYVKSKDKSLTIVAVYVDDLLLLSNNRQMKDETKKRLHQEFKMRDLGEVYSLLGMRIKRDCNLGTISINQQTYIEQIIRRFNMQDSNPVRTPLDTNVKLSKDQEANTEEEKRKMSKVPYREALGSSMYVCQGIQPDIAHAISLLSQFSGNPGKIHWTALKRLFRYLKGTLNYKLQFRKDGNKHLEGYCDADWAGEIDKRRSTTGYLFRLQDAAISWKSKRQSSIALSTTEAEYMAMAAAVQEAMWLRVL
ncbi:retrovirus-related pol polyprotein from transposon tnt 1-94, partial [Lasius niger]